MSIYIEEQKSFKIIQKVAKQIFPVPWGNVPENVTECKSGGEPGVKGAWRATVQGVTRSWT